MSFSKHNTLISKGASIACQSLFSLCLTAANPQTSRPNIVFILTDDQSSISIAAKSANQSRPFGFNGDANVFTPSIDSLAKNGWYSFASIHSTANIYAINI